MKRKLFVIFPVIFALCFVIGASPLIPTLIDYYTPKETTTESSDAGTGTGTGTDTGTGTGTDAPILRVAASPPADSTADSIAESIADSAAESVADSAAGSAAGTDTGTEAPRQISRPAAYAALGFAGASVIFGLVILIRKSNPDK